MSRLEKIKTGLPGLDGILQNVRQGESVVWQISDGEDYAYFARHFADQAIKEGRNVIYFRFSDYPALLQKQEGLKIIRMDLNSGFEKFTVSIYKVISKQDPGTFYVFDCMSQLQTVWAADFMMRNFFKAICPALKEMKGTGYFSIAYKGHSYDSISQIKETADIYINTVSGPEGIYVQPLKAVNRKSPTMFFPHLISDEKAAKLPPITDGISSSKYYGLLKIKARNPGQRFLDNWDVFLMEAQTAMLEESPDKELYEKKLYKMLIGRDQERANLFKSNYTIQDYLNINLRLVGTGSIGGKAAGMLLARKIIENNRPDLAEHIEEHDSFYVGSNVFYTFLIRNNWWKLWLEHKSDEGYFMAARVLKSQIPYGEFPDLVKEKFRRLIDHYGQNPIIVRSSSLLEDGFGNAFAGKYDSIFCVNIGSPEERYEQFVKAVKDVYASAMDESALIYRKQRGLDKADEQMSILVQRVSGSVFEDVFMPGAAGVGYSMNSYTWNKSIDPNEGMIRIVAGLGTRAVNRTFQDYPRLAALDKPALKPSMLPEDRFRFVQKNVDVLDFTENTLLTIPLEEVAEKAPKWYNSLFVEHDYDTENRLKDMGRKQQVISTTCERMLKNEELVSTMREVLKTLHDHYKYPVDIEFTINFSEKGEFLINLLQCRPLQSKGTGIAGVKIPEVPEEKMFMKLFKNTMGGPTKMEFDMVVIVDAKGYAEMPYKEKFSVANAIHAVNTYAGQNKKSLMILGPGRWGTNSAELGIPVRYAQISNVNAIFEMSFESSGLMPELSFGSHFFQDLVETNTFYGAVFEKDSSEGVKSIYRPQVLENEKEVYDEIPDTIKALRNIIKVYELEESRMVLVADSKGEETVCWKEKENPKSSK